MLRPEHGNGYMNTKASLLSLTCITLGKDLLIIWHGAIMFAQKSKMQMVFVCRALPEDPLSICRISETFHQND